MVAVHLPYPGLPKPEPGRGPTPGQPAPGPVTPQRMLPGFVEHVVPQSLDPYQRLYAERVIFVATPLSDEAGNDVVAKLLDLDSDGSDMEITLQLNSAGGSWSALLAVVDTMRFIGRTVRTVCVGQADGPAAVLLACGAEGRRFVRPMAQVILRPPSAEASSTDVQTELDRVTWQHRQVERILAESTGRSIEEIHDDIERPRMFTAEQAVEYGLADGILPSRR